MKLKTVDCDIIAVAYPGFYNGGEPPPLALPSLPFPFLSLPPLRSRPSEIQLGGLGSAVSSPSGVWGGAPAEIEFGAF